MKPEHWERLKQLFHSALEHEPGERTEFLQQACAGDESLRAEVESMLQRYTESPDFLETPALLAEARQLAGELKREDRSPIQEPATAAKSGLSSRRFAPPARPPLWMYALAAVFVADCLLRSYCYIFGPQWFDFKVRTQGEQQVIVGVPAGSAAERAGIQPGDILLALDGQPFRRFPKGWRMLPNLETGRLYRFDVERNGQRLQLTYPMQYARLLESRNRQEHAVWQINGILLLATALFIAWKRPFDLLTRAGAMALGTLSVSLYFTNLPPGYAVLWRALPLQLGTLLWIPNICTYLVGPIILTFFVIFPRPLFRAHWPWAVVWVPALSLVPVYFRDTFIIVYQPLQVPGGLAPDEIFIIGVRLFGLYGLASLAALAVNYFRLTNINERRRLRVLLVGGGIAVLPGALRLFIWQFAPLSAAFRWLFSGVPSLVVVLAFAFFPITFAYSILRHRLFDIRIIIRQGVQYAVARGALLSVVPFLAVTLLLDLLLHGDQPLIEILKMRGWIYALLATLAVAAHSQRHRWGEAIDRRFFREQYDARRLLREIAGETLRGRSLAHAAPAVVARIETALHPDFAAILQRESDDTVFRTVASSPSGRNLDPLVADSGLVSILRTLGDPLEAAQGESGWLRGQLPEHELEFLRKARIDLLVPVALDSGSDEALLALGPKRSEEPFTREDQDLLAAIAANLGLLLERPHTPQPGPRQDFEECPICGACYDTGAGRCSQEGTGLTPVHMPRMLADRYLLERRRGRGGMGMVYEATDRALQRRVAIKVIREDRLHNAEVAQRFRREARAAAGLAGPHFVTVYDYGVEAGRRAFLVMELLDGATLRDEIRRQGRLGGARTIHIFRGVCSAVETAHTRHLIHRDLKPENIFLARVSGGNGETAKILDFGIAKFLSGWDEGSDAIDVTETDAGILVGTPAYMSPEQLLGEKPDVSWDLWALAVTVYETLTGALPFPTADRERWRRSLLAGRYTPLRNYLADCPVGLERFFSAALATGRELRPRSARELLHRLEKALA